MRALCLIAVLLTGGAEVKATTVLGIWTDSIIVIGADSKVSRADHSETWVRCKIKIANNVAWGEEGILEAPGFSIDQIAANTMSEGGPIEARIADFEALIVPPLTQTLNALKNENPDRFRADHEGGSVVQILFGTFDGGVAHLHLRYFRAVSSVLGLVFVETNRVDCPSKLCRPPFALTLGVHDIIDKEMANENPALWSTMSGIESTARHLINKEIEAAPDKVGPPVALLTITRDGPHWIDKGPCDPH